MWSNYKKCPSGKRVIGFQIKVEADAGGGDDTGLNGVNLKCQDGATSGEVTYLWGSWRAWKTCSNNGYVIEVDVKGTASLGASADDYGATNMRMKCSEGDILDGGGLSNGQWAGYQGCPAGSFFCGAKAQIESDAGAGDDTTLNRIQMGCCGEYHLPNLPCTLTVSNSAPDFIFFCIFYHFSKSQNRDFQK